MAEQLYDAGYQPAAFQGNAFQSTPSIIGALTVSEAPDTVAVSGTVSWKLLFGGNESPDVAVFNANAVTITFVAATEDRDTISASGSSISYASFALSEVSDTVSLAGSLDTSFTLKPYLEVYEPADVASISVSIATASLSLTATEAADVSFALAFLVSNGSFALSEADDTASFATDSQWLLALNATEAGDVSAITTAVVATGSLSSSENGDSAYVSVGVYSTASLNATDGNDTASFDARIIASQTMEAYEARDTANLTGYATTYAVLSVSENPDRANSPGTVFWPVEFALTELPDVFQASAFIAPNVGSMAATEGRDSSRILVYPIWTDKGWPGSSTWSPARNYNAPDNKAA